MYDPEELSLSVDLEHIKIKCALISFSKYFRVFGILLNRLEHFSDFCGLFCP